MVVSLHPVWRGALGRAGEHLVSCGLGRGCCPGRTLGSATALPRLPGCCSQGELRPEGGFHCVCKLGPRGQRPRLRRDHCINNWPARTLGNSLERGPLASLHGGDWPRLGLVFGSLSSSVKYILPHSCPGLLPPRWSSDSETLLCAWAPEVLARCLCGQTATGELDMGPQEPVRPQARVGCGPAPASSPAWLWLS